jgi:lysophospholipase L1-like esterase
MAPQKKMKVIFFGDSITELGAKPGGFISRMDSLCKLENKNDQFEFIGAGISGNKIYDLYLRMEDDVLNKNPDMVIIYIGINDVWHKRLLSTGTDPDRFEKFYDAILKKLKAKNITAILCTPSVIGEKTDFSNQQDGDLNYYSNMVRNIAAKNNLQCIDLRKLFLDYNLSNNVDNKDRGILTVDGVHLNPRGNELIAEEMWKVIRNFK